MTEGKKQFAKYLLVFGLGSGFGVAGGFALNDYVERGDPDLVQEIQQQVETQGELDDFFAQQQREAQNGVADTNPDQNQNQEQGTEE